VVGKSTGPRFALVGLVVAIGCVTIPDTKTLVGELGGSGGTSGNGKGGSSSSKGGTDGGTESGEGGDTTGSGGTVASGGTESGGTGTGGTVGGGSTGGTSMSACTPEGPEVGVPFAVDDHFFASGYGADPPSEVTSIVEAPCDVPPDPPGTYGSCHEFTFHPQTQNAALTSSAWVYWQSPAQNWGSEPGRDIGPSATAVRFRAWSEAGGDTVTVAFFAGSSGGACADVFTEGDIAVEVQLTDTPTELEMLLPDKDYSGGVVNGFGWAMTVAATLPVSFYVDNIRWE